MAGSNCRSGPYGSFDGNISHLISLRMILILIQLYQIISCSSHSTPSSGTLAYHSPPGVPRSMSSLRQAVPLHQNHYLPSPLTLPPHYQYCGSPYLFLPLLLFTRYRSAAFTAPTFPIAKAYRSTVLFTLRHIYQAQPF